MIGEAAEECYSKIGFPENETSMVRRWLNDLEPVNYLENLGRIDHCACFPRTQSQRTYVEREVLTIPLTQLMHAVVSCFTTFADRSFFSFLLILRRMGKKKRFSSPHFHVFSYASCVDLTQLLSQPNASWRTLRVPL